MYRVIEAGTPVNVTDASTTVLGGPGGLMGILVASATVGATLTVKDGSTTKVNAFPLIAGNYYPVPMLFSTSCVIELDGTVDATVFLRTE